jgi:hypothetical protein
VPRGGDPGVGRDPYRVSGNRAETTVHADAVLRLFVTATAAHALDDVGRAHVFDGAGALTASIEVGPLADASLHDGGGSLAIATYGRGVTSIQGAAADARRFLSHVAPVLACVGTSEGLVVGDQAGEVTLLVPEAGAARASPEAMRAPILSLAASGSALAVLTADGELLTGTWPRQGTLTPTRGLRANRAHRVLGLPSGAGFVLLDRERVHAITSGEVAHTSRDFEDGVLAFAPLARGGFLLTDAGRVHHLDPGLRASAALTLGVGGRARGLVAIGERAAVWTTRGELVLVASDGRTRLVANEGVLAATSDPRTGDVVVVQGGRGLAIRRHPPS